MRLLRIAARSRHGVGLTRHPPLPFPPASQRRDPRDQRGTELPSQAAAQEYASTVAQELMLYTSSRTCHWSLRAEGEKGEALFDLYFADVDARLVVHPPKVRMTASETSRRIGALTDAVCAAQKTLLESHLLLARTQGKPRLVYAKRN